MAHLSRRHTMSAVGVAAAALVGGLATPAVAHRRGPLKRAHAHNDYEHEHPLFDALSHGFASVEADIWLVDGHLLVAHDEVDLDPSRTLESLYLDPLFELVRRNHGSVFRGGRLPLQLLIDIKSAGDPTYRELARHLRRYRPMLTEATRGRVSTGAVTAVISGDRAARVPMEEEIASGAVSLAFYDGRLADLGSGAPASFIPLISDNWTSSFTWRGEGEFPAEERELLRDLVGRAHAAGQRVRFWETVDVAGPARDAVWGELLAAGVDHLNTDDLAGLEDFLRAHDRGRGR
ncbi:phosphatidylinositol-specific phospholipase C/glycerophosphodiester phosphodiesterase family protein [Streptomyces hoynatensis]|uniref:Altered inheritance of mitochondria protein 6 n=1 Tax=Streptomyces hoynatensis TaxID=1141874 RepID=A0A3A9Z3Z8_9ACTN|nr:phosphatidylinositol-specific phospholipase C/glycerophosphodiester phosphodiesterase family protein [Streptomyces hoynatensis]RKN42995.1 hypothetical protein D7294_10755 [Streptomyces hoynatensis]